jgi:hypothetical protein
VTESEIDILTALIVMHVRAKTKDRMGDTQYISVDERYARVAAQKILSCGFSMASRPVDDLQDEEIDELQVQVEQLRGWSGLPPELRR